MCSMSDFGAWSKALEAKRELLMERSQEILIGLDADHQCGYSVPRWARDLLLTGLLEVKVKCDFMHAPNQSFASRTEGAQEVISSWTRHSRIAQPGEYTVYMASVGNVRAVVDDFGTLVPCEHARELAWKP